MKYKNRKKKLEARINDYNKNVATNRVNGRGFRKPGSQSK